MRKKLVVFTTILAIVLGGVLYVFLFSKPKVINLENFEKLTKEKEITLKLENIRNTERVIVKIVQDGKEVVLYDGTPMSEIKLRVKPKSLGLKEGSARVVVELRRFFFIRDTYSVLAKVDYTPPRVGILFSPYAVMNGGSGAVRITLSEKASLKLKVGELSFPFYDMGNNVYVSLFAIPINFSGNVVIVAEDEIGNVTKVEIPSLIKRKRYPRYRIELKGREKKIELKLANLLGEEVNKLSFVEAFKKVNEELREENERFITEIGKKSEEKLYWKGRFLQLRNSKVVSVFGEKRIYTYGGKKISESYHWGYDLASVRNAPVEAANDGKVVFTGFLGIYGNTVIIDHGYGLMSLYGHLAEFRVKKGDRVKKGQIIGYTDTTGLAFGDHLHYEMTIHGVPVNPIEWWDGKWIKNNILPAFQPSVSR